MTLPSILAITFAITTVFLYAAGFALMSHTVGKVIDSKRGALTIGLAWPLVAVFLVIFNPDILKKKQ